MPILTLLALVLFGAILSAFGGILLKFGAMKIGRVEGVTDILALALNWQIVAGLMMYFIPAVVWILLLRKVELSLLQPLMAIVYVITPVLAIFFFKEHVSLLRWTGIAIIMLGVFLVSRT